MLLCPAKQVAGGGKGRCWEVIDRANHKTGLAFAGNRGLARDTGMGKDTANTMLHVLHKHRLIDLEPGNAATQSIAYPLLDGKRWPGPSAEDMRASDAKGQGVRRVRTGVLLL